jgi:SAM-dependent methyltransferase
MHYGVLPERYWKDEYFTCDPFYLKGIIDLFHSLHGASRTNNGLTALDVGAGIGKGMVALARAGFKAHGLEPSEPFCRMAIERSGVAREQLTLSTVEDAVFEESSFDFVNMSAVVEHLYDPATTLRKVLTWLKPDGLIYVEVPSSEWLMPRLARLFYRATGSDYVINLSPMHPPYHIYEFTPRSFQFHAAANGYTLALQQYYVCDSYMPKPLKPLFDRFMSLTNTGMQLAVWLRKSAAGR